MKKTKRRSSSMSLPKNIIVDILLTLPVKTLKRFESLSKSFYSLINSHDFVYAHLKNQTPSPYLLTRRSYHNGTEADCSICLFNLQTRVTTDIRIPFYQYLLRFPKIVGSCNGIVCLDISMCFGFGFVLWNVATRQFRFLPRATVYGAIWMVGCGFGFDSKTGDYKLVRIVSFKSDDRAAIGAEIFSLKSNCWRLLDSAEEQIGNYIVNEGQNGVFSNNGNGCLNWVTNEFGKTGRYCGRRSIISFDLGSEEFRRIQIPADYGADVCAKLMAFKDKIAVIFHAAYILSPRCGRISSRIELWVYDDSDIKKWSNPLDLNLNPSTMGTPICIQNGDVPKLLIKRITQESIDVGALNLVTGQFATQQVCSAALSCEFYSHVESLVGLSDAGGL